MGLQSRGTNAVIREALIGLQEIATCSAPCGSSQLAEIEGIIFAAEFFSATYQVNDCF